MKCRAGQMAAVEHSSSRSVPTVPNVVVAFCYAGTIVGARRNGQSRAWATILPMMQSIGTTARFLKIPVLFPLLRPPFSPQNANCPTNQLQTACECRCRGQANTRNEKSPLAGCIVESDCGFGVEENLLSRSGIIWEMFNNQLLFLSQVLGQKA